MPAFFEAARCWNYQGKIWDRSDARLASQVDIIEYQPEVRANQLLHEKVAEMPNMSVTVNHEVKEFNVKNNRLDGVVVENRAAGEVITWHYDGIFVFIGLIPNSNLIKENAEIDPYGFVITDRTLMTSLPGLFIDGDVRAGSTKTGCSSGRGSCNGGTHDSRILERKWINEAQDDQFGSAPADLR